MLSALLMIGLLAGDVDIEREMREMEELEKADCQKNGEKMFEKCSRLCQQTARRTNDRAQVKACLNDCGEVENDIRSSCYKGQAAVREFRKKPSAEQERILREDAAHKHAGHSH